MRTGKRNLLLICGFSTVVLETMDSVFCFLTYHVLSSVTEVFSPVNENMGRDPFNQNSNRSDRKKWSTSKGGPWARSIQPKFRPVRPEKEDHLKRWTCWARSIQPKFPEISVQNSMDRFGPTGKVSKKRSTF